MILYHGSTDLVKRPEIRKTSISDLLPTIISISRYGFLKQGLTMPNTP